MSYVGKIITAVPNVDTGRDQAPESEYFCTSERDGLYRLIPLEGPYWFFDEVMLELGLDAGWLIKEATVDTEKARMLEMKIGAYVASVTGARHECAKRNLTECQAAIFTLEGALYRCNSTPVEPPGEAGGGKSGRVDYVGDLIFIEPRARGEFQMHYGEYVCIQQSENCLYCFPTDCLERAETLFRVPYAGELASEVTIVSHYRDDAFLRDMIERIRDHALMFTLGNEIELCEEGDASASSGADDLFDASIEARQCAHALEATAAQIERILDKRDARSDPYFAGKNATFRMIYGNREEIDFSNPHHLQFDGVLNGVGVETKTCQDRGQDFSRMAR